MTDQIPTVEPVTLETANDSFSGCGACTLNAATTAFEAVPLGAIIPSNSPSSSIVFFSAYSITSTYRSDGLCVTTTGTPIPITPELSITKPAAANNTAFASSVTSLLKDHLGFTTCTGGGEIVIASDLVQIINATSVNATSGPIPTNATISSATTTIPSSASNNSSSPPTISSAAANISSGFTTKDKATTGVVVPVFAIISIVLGAIFFLRRRRRHSRSGKDTKGSKEEAQPYLQQKAELDAEEQRRLELEAVEVRYEMDGKDCINEITADAEHEIDTTSRPQMPSLKERHELRGEECSKELEAP